MVQDVLVGQSFRVLQDYPEYVEQGLVALFGVVEAKAVLFRAVGCRHQSLDIPDDAVAVGSISLWVWIVQLVVLYEFVELCPRRLLLVLEPVDCVPHDNLHINYESTPNSIRFPLVPLVQSHRTALFPLVAVKAVHDVLHIGRNHILVVRAHGLEVIELLEECSFDHVQQRSHVQAVPAPYRAIQLVGLSRLQIVTGR